MFLFYNTYARKSQRLGLISTARGRSHRQASSLTCQLILALVWDLSCCTYPWSFRVAAWASSHYGAIFPNMNNLDKKGRNCIDVYDQTLPVTSHRLQQSPAHPVSRAGSREPTPKWKEADDIFMRRTCGIRGCGCLCNAKNLYASKAVFSVQFSPNQPNLNLFNSRSQKHLFVI